MWRVAFSYAPGVRLPTLTFAGVWRAMRCYDVPRDSMPYTLPIKVSTDHGRKRLLLLTPERLTARQERDPRESLRAYLLTLPVEVKIARAAEAR